MDNPKRRRGISLAHHSAAPALPQDALPATRLHYSRYPVSQSPSRHASAPKPKVTFAYVLAQETAPCSPCPAYSRNPSAYTLPEQPHPHLSARQPGRIEVRRVPTPELRQFELPPADPAPSALSAYRLPCNPLIQTAPAHQVTSVSPLSPQQPPPEQTPASLEGGTALSQSEQPLLERYVSFEHCKESIAKRIFAGSGVSGASGVSASSREETQSRSNRWVDPTVEASLPVVENKTRKLNLEIQRSVFSFVPDPKPKAHHPETVLREAVTQTASEISKENVAPAPAVVQEKEVKEKKGRRDPMKLKEMEQRLLQIIKICDENM